MRKILAIIAAGLMFAAACSTDDGSAEVSSDGIAGATFQVYEAWREVADTAYLLYLDDTLPDDDRDWIRAIRESAGSNERVTRNNALSFARNSKSENRQRLQEFDLLIDIMGELSRISCSGSTPTWSEMITIYDVFLLEYNSDPGVPDVTVFPCKPIKALRNAGVNWSAEASELL